MNYSEAFAILMIEVKKDENAIKVAYRNLLPQNNPEENPEGFKLLRKAYEVALEYARSTDKEEEIVTVDLSNPVSVWMGTVVEVYKSLSRRFNVDEWRKILEDDVCNSLDYYEDAKRTLFEFLRDYHKVPKEVYILLNEKYNFVEQQNNLKEYLPIECVDFMVRMATEEDYKEVCDVKYLECADDADYDRFSSMIYQVQNIVYDQKSDMDKVPLMLKQIDALNISHPLYDSFKARYYAEIGDADKANEILEKLDSIEALKEDIYMKVIIADTMMLTGKKERAREILEYFSKREYMYKCEEILAEYYCDNDELALAMNSLNKIRYNSKETVESNDIRKKVHEKYIERYELTNSVEDWSEEDYYNLLYAYLRFQGGEKTLELMNTSNKDISDEIKKYRILSYIYMEMEHFEEAIKYVDIVINRCEQKLENNEFEDEEAKKQLTRLLVDNLYNKAVQLLEISYIKEIEESKELLIQAYEISLKAEQIEDDYIDIKVLQLDLLYNLKRYEQAYKLGEELLKIDKHHLGVMIRMQKIAFKLGRAQDVVDYFFKVQKIYDKFSPIYTNAIRTYVIYNQLEDAKNVLEDAIKAGLEDDFAIRVAKVFIRHANLNELNLEERVKLADDINNLIKEGDETSYREFKASLAYIYVEMIYKYCDRNGYSEAYDTTIGELKELLKRRTKYEYDNPSYNMLYAKLCEKEKNFDEAIEEYKKVIEESGDAEDIEYNMAICYARMYDYKNALKSIEKVEELGKDSNFNDINLAHLYEELGNCMKNVAYINKAITYFIKQHKKNYKQDAEYLNYRIAENYNKIGNYVAAKKYISEIILDGVAYSVTSLKTKIAFYQKDYESAIIMSDIALRDYFVTYAETLGVHWQLAYDLTEIQALSFVRTNRVYKALELWEDVPRAFKELEDFEKFRIFEDTVKSQIQICLDEKMYDEAEKIINTKQKYLSRDRYYYEVIRLNLLRANTKKEYKKVFDMAENICKEIDAEFIKYITAVAALLGEDDVNVACSYFDKLFADRTLNTLWNVNNFLKEYICILDLIGEENKKQYYINKFNECLTATYIEEEKTTRIDKFLSEPSNQFYGLCMAMQIWCVSGDSDCLKMAGKYIQRLEKMKEDPYSYRGGVTQRIEALAIYYEKIGEIEKAEELYEKLIEADDENSYYALFRRKWKNKSVDAEKDQNKSNKNGSLFAGLKDALRDKFK